MNFLGIDLGRKNTGLAYSEGILASPLETVRHNSLKEAVSKISKICRELSIDCAVVGFSSGKGEKMFQKFAKQLESENEGLGVVLWDETLSTRQARSSMIKLQVPKTKRKVKEHEFAASIILESYLESGQ